MAPDLLAWSETKGTALRDNALALHEQKSGDFVTSARTTFLAILAEKGTASMDDLRAVIKAPDDTDPRAFGAVVMGLSRAGLIERAGYVNTKNAKAHARPLAVWKLKTQGE